MTRKERTKKLVLKYIDNSCSANELEELLTMLRNNTADLQEFDAAAKICWDRERNVPPREAQMHYQEQARKLLRKTADVRKRQSSGWLTIVRRTVTIAASVALLSIGGYYTLHGIFNDARTKETSYASIEVGLGEIRRIELPDGTQVTLNAASSIRYNRRYGKEDRRVWLTGEAFFDVKYDPEHPFLIHSNKLNIRVLGTSFNVKAYPEDIQTAVTVRTGKVGVSYDQDDIRMSLQPEEQLLIDTRNHTVSRTHTAVEDALSWIHGNLTFSQLPISEVVKMLRRHYASDIVLQDTTSHALLSGTHDNKSLESVLQSICFSAGLQYKKEENRYLIY